jgi:hypothetical protein
MAQSDPEVLYDMMQRWRSSCLAHFARFEGYVAQHLNEGFVVYFGYPQAREDDAPRAIRAGRVPEACGYSFGTSPNPAERDQSAGDQHSKPVFRTQSMTLAPYLRADQILHTPITNPRHV